MLRDLSGRIALSAVLLVSACLLAPSAAGAATASYSSATSTVTYLAAPGEENHVTTRIDNQEYVITDDVTITAGDHCAQMGPHSVACGDMFPVAKVSMSLGDQIDRLDARVTSEPIDVDAGAGKDGPILTGGGNDTIDLQDEDSDSNTYCGDGNDTVEIDGPLSEPLDHSIDPSCETIDAAPAPKPTVSIGTVSALATTIRFGGFVNPHGRTTTYHWEYWKDGDDPSSAASTPETGVRRDDMAVASNATVDGLEQGTRYWYRLVATGPGGTARSFDYTVTTRVNLAPSGFVSVGAQSSFASSAYFGGNLNPNGLDTRYHFEYRVQSSEPTRSTPEQTIVSAAFSPVAIGGWQDGLTSGTNYEVRLVATNAVGTLTTGWSQFKTRLLSAPRVDKGVASAIATTAATLGSHVEFNGAVTTYHFEYRKGGSGAAWTSAGPSVRAGGGGDFGGSDVSVRLSGLIPRTSYEFRLVASNAYGTTNGSSGYFTSATAGIALNATTRTLTYQAAGAQDNDLRISSDGTNVTVRDAALETMPDNDGAGGCSATGNVATCPLADVTTLVLYTLDGNDSVRVTAPVKVTLMTGAGDDTVKLSNPSSSALGSTVYGEAGADMITGGSAKDKLYGGTENDTLVGGGGKDKLKGEAGDDTLDGRDVPPDDTQREVLSCGAGNDSVKADRRDRAAACETVTRP